MKKESVLDGRMRIMMMVSSQRSLTYLFSASTNQYPYSHQLLRLSLQLDPCSITCLATPPCLYSRPCYVAALCFFLVTFLVSLLVYCLVPFLIHAVYEKTLIIIANTAVVQHIQYLKLYNISN